MTMRSSLSDQLDRAIQKKDIQQVASLLRAGADVNKPVSGFPPLHTAAISGSVGIVELLLENKADLFSVNAISGTALTLAAINGHPHIIDLLVAQGLHPDHFGKNTHSHPLIQSVTLSSEKMSLHLLKAGASTDIFSAEGAPLICLAAQYGQLGVLKACIATAPKDYINMALHFAVREKKRVAVEMLIKAGANVNHFSDGKLPDMEDDVTPLHYLCNGDGGEDLRIARMLLDHGADADLAKTPAHLSAYELACSHDINNTRRTYNNLMMRELFQTFREEKAAAVQRRKERKDYLLNMAHNGIPHKIRAIPKINPPKK